MVSEATDGVRDALATGRVTAYIGFDPTASSLHIGNLLTVMGLARLAEVRARPIALVGGGTGMIGDPSGKSQERNLLSAEQIDVNVAGVRAQLERVPRLRRPRPNAAKIVNNADWLGTDRRAVVPARRRQALLRRLHAAEGIGQPPHRERRRHLVHRVQLSRAAGLRFPAAVRSPRLHPANGRQRSMGQHHGGHRADPESARQEGARTGLAADEDGRGHEVRQDRGGHHLARSGADIGVPLLPVLAEHRRSRCRELLEGLHVARPRRDRRARARDGGGAGGARRAAHPRARGDDEGARRGRAGAGGA